jgi:hypothetical protein
MPVPITHQLGHLPRPAKRSVVFIANLQSIFFEQQEETQLLSATVNGIDSYGGRLVPILQFLYPGDHNLLILERPPAPELLAWYGDVLNLQTPQIAVLPHYAYCDPAHPETVAIDVQLNAHAAPWVDGYVTDARLSELAAGVGKNTRSSPDASRIGNNKLLLHRHLVANDLPTFRTTEADSPPGVAAALVELHKAGYRHACIKAAIGASGIGMCKVPTDRPPPSLPNFYFNDWPCLVQGWEDESRPGTAAIESPSVQLWLDDASVDAYDLTSQILSAESIHEGNSAPPPWRTSRPDIVAEILAQTDVAATWLHDLGYRGAASIDFHLAWPESEGPPNVRICEINARVTGATYPAILARHFLPYGAWRMQNLHFPKSLSCAELLAALNNSSRTFRPDANAGLIPINANLAPDGQVQKCQMLALGKNLESCAICMTALETALPVESVHDRD